MCCMKIVHGVERWEGGGCVFRKNEIDMHGEWWEDIRVLVICVYCKGNNRNSFRRVGQN